MEVAVVDGYVVPNQTLLTNKDGGVLCNGSKTIIDPAAVAYGDLGSGIASFNVSVG